MFRNITILTFAAALMLTSAAQAQAPVSAAAKQIAVNYTDLNIGQPVGAAELIARMHAAATQACGPAPDVRELVRSRAYRQCISDSVARAVADVNSPVVTQLFHGSVNPGLAVAAR